MTCSTGEVCGRFDFRAIDPDSGMYTGPVEEIVRACRPRITATCSTSNPCATGAQICLGDPGVCTTRCAEDRDCASALCIATSADACGAGRCAPLCDDTLECPTSWYCNLSGADSVGHGRCEPIDPMSTQRDAGCD